MDEEGYAVRVYRRRNYKDFKDLDNKKFNFDGLYDFIIKSTFIGPAPGILRELSIENSLKIF